MGAPRNEKFQWQDAIKAAARDDLKSTDRHVALTLATKDNGTGAPWWYSLEDLAAHTATSVRTVQRSLDRLQKGGWLLQVKRGRRLSDGTTRSSEWRLTFPQGAEDDIDEASGALSNRSASTSANQSSRRPAGRP